MHINTLINPNILQPFPQKNIPGQLFRWLYTEIYFDWFGIYPPIHTYVIYNFVFVVVVVVFEVGI